MTVYSPDHLPTGEWRTYRKTVLTRMCWAHGPCTVRTIDGASIDLPPDWEGFIAVDHLGWPYPVDAEIHADAYELADEYRD